MSRFVSAINHHYPVCQGRLFSYLTPFTLTYADSKASRGEPYLDGQLLLFRQQENGAGMSSQLRPCNTANLKVSDIHRRDGVLFLKYQGYVPCTLFNPIIDSNRVANLKLRHDGLKLLIHKCVDLFIRPTNILPFKYRNILQAAEDCFAGGTRTT